MDTRETQRLTEIISFAHNYVEADRFAETLGRVLLDLDVESDRVSVALVALALVYVNQQAEAGRSVIDDDEISDTIYNVLSDVVTALPAGVRDRCLRAFDSTTSLHKAIVGMVS